MNPKESLQRLVDALSPGARRVSLRRLKGGLGARMHVLRFETASRERRTVVLRRYRTEWRNSTPERACYEFDVLGLVAKAGIAAPRPLLLDADGQYFGGPAMVLSYTPGRSFFHHADEAAWVDGLAQGLASVHAMTPQRFDLSRVRPVQTAAEDIEAVGARIMTAEPLAQETFEVLNARLAGIAPAPTCLVHDDYWPGNTVWYRGRLVAVVDWADAGLGDPRVDVAQCRADLVFSHGLETADAFLRCYEAAAPHAMQDLWFFDLLRGLRALLHHEKWLEGYHDAGMRHLELADVGERIRAFLRQALRMGLT